MVKRREYGEGSIFQRCEPRYGCPPLEQVGVTEDGKPIRRRPKHTCRARWHGLIEAGSTTDGKRRRIDVSGKTRADVVRKIRDKRGKIAEGGIPTQAARTTVKQWAEVYLKLKKAKLSPRGYNAAASPIRCWVVPTIGHRRLEALTPADVRAVEKAQRDAGLKGSTAAATHRALLTMLRAAIVEGHPVPQRVLLVEGPTTSKSDRLDIPREQAAACLLVASELPHGTRWALSLLYGVRQGEALGLTEEYVDFDEHEIRLEWQLDSLAYEHACDPPCGAKRAASCPQRRFRVPDEYEARHLIDSFHLVRPKSKAGTRVLPMTPELERAMRDWLAARPDNPWGLVWPTTTGRPANDKHDLAEWHGIQGAASVLPDLDDETRVTLSPLPVGHPGGRYWHGHETRNFAATALGDAGVDPEVIKSLLGHATAAMSGEYRRIHRAPKMAAIEQVAALLPFAQGD